MPLVNDEEKYRNEICTSNVHNTWIMWTISILNRDSVADYDLNTLLEYTRAQQWNINWLLVMMN